MHVSEIKLIRFAEEQHFFISFLTSDYLLNSNIGIAPIPMSASPISQNH
jgi:hypothetical protein